MMRSDEQVLTLRQIVIARDGKMPGERRAMLNGDIAVKTSITAALIASKGMKLRSGAVTADHNIPAPTFLASLTNSVSADHPAPHR